MPQSSSLTEAVSDNGSLASGASGSSARTMGVWELRVLRTIKRSDAQLMTTSQGRFVTTTLGRTTTREGRTAVLAEARDFFARNGLYRSRDAQVLGGVCAGLGRRIQLRPWPARLLFLLVLVLLPGSPLIVYPVLWVLLPLEQAPTTTVVGWGSAAGPAADPRHATAT